MFTCCVVLRLDFFLWALCFILCLLYFWQKCIEAEFLYFGLKFYHLTARVSEDELYSKVPFCAMNDITDGASAGILQVIQDDMQKLCLSEVGMKVNWKANGCFRKVENTYVYVYCHTQHAACSSTYLSQLEGCYIIEDMPCYMSICSLHRHHDHLQPFFSDNRHLLSYYEHALANGRQDVKPQIDQLKKILGGQSFKGTAFVCPAFTANNWDENVWTQRLAIGIEKTFSDHELEVTFSAPMGPRFDSDVLGALRVESIPSECFLFRGAPDILIHHQVAVIDAGQVGPGPVDESSEEGALENTHQRPPLKGCLPHGGPEKTGELIAALHIILVSKILRRIVKGKNTQRKFTVRGLLLDKICATVQCSLSVQMTQDAAVGLNISLQNYVGTFLTPELLCSHIRALIEGLV